MDRWVYRSWESIEVAILGTHIAHICGVVFPMPNQDSTSRKLSLCCISKPYSSSALLFQLLEGKGSLPWIFVALGWSIVKLKRQDGSAILGTTGIPSHLQSDSTYLIPGCCMVLVVPLGPLTTPGPKSPEIPQGKRNQSESIFQLPSQSSRAMLICIIQSSNNFWSGLINNLMICKWICLSVESKRNLRKWCVLWDTSQDPASSLGSLSLC